MTLRRLVRRSSRRGAGWRTGRLGRRVRRVTAAALGPVLAAAGAVLPVVPAAAVAAGAVAAATAASVATAPSAKAASGAPVLVLVQNGATSAPEATLLAAAGYTVTQVTPATWLGMSSAQFAQYAALVIGDPSSGGSCSSLTPTTGSSGSDALGTNWQSAVTGNLAVLGTAPAQPGTTAANTLITDSVGYAAAGFNSANSSGTGLYVSLNCEYSSASAPADVSLLDGIDGAGSLAVQGGLSCTDPGTVNTWEAARAGTFAGFTSSSLAASAWGSACPVDEAFTKWPAMFTPAAYDAAGDAADNFTASDGATGQPYILLGSPISAATAALAPSAGGEVLGGTTAGGTSNPAAPGVQQGSAGDPVNTEDGSFTQSYTDVSLPGFGPSLDFTRSYDSTQAQKQTQAGTPGPMGYGWTDNWATSLSAAEPTPGDIYAAEGLRTGNGDGGPANSSITSGPAGVTVDGAGDVYFADTLNNRIQEVPATSGTQWGVSMTAGDVYTVAGQPDGQDEEPLQGGQADGTPALQAVLHHPEGVTVDSSGDLFIADTQSCRVLEVQPDGDNGTGVIDTVAGVLGQCGYNADGISATSAYLSQPTSVKLGQSSGQTQDLYIADSANNRIRMIPARNENPWNITGGMQAGDIYTVVGPGPANGAPTANGTAEQSADLNDPLGVTLNGGNMFIADSGNCRIAVDSQGGGTIFNVATSADKIYTVAGRNGPGNCLTGDDNKAAISSDLDVPTSVRDPNGNLYITDSHMNRVQRVNSAGTVTTASNGFSNPQDLAADGSGDIFVADTGNSIISEVPAGSGSPSLFAGGSLFTLTDTGNGGPAVNAALKNPAAVASDGHGDVFIADQDNNRIQEIAAYAHTQFGISMLAGDAYTVAGNQFGTSGGTSDGVAATSTNLSQPSGVAADSAGDLYIADTGDAAIRKVDASTGIISTVAGTLGATGPFTGNGTAATSATLGNPTAVTVDATGDVFVADSGNNEVLDVPASGGSHYGISGMTAGDIYVIAGASSIPTAPAAPTGLTVTGTTSSSVSLSWTAPSGTVTGYQVYLQGTFSNTLEASPTTTSVTITGLTPSTSYTFFVKAVNSAGAGPASSIVSATTPSASAPAAPTGLGVTGTTTTTVSLSWTAPAGTVTGYKVFENGSSTALSSGVSISGTTAAVSGLTASTTYTFTVAATNSAGTGAQSSSVSATTSASGGGVPAAPTGLTVTGTTLSSVSLSWTAPAGTVTGYKVFKNGSSTPLSSGVSISGTTATVSGLSAFASFTFTVAAVNASGTGPQSNSVSASTTGGTGGLSSPVRLLATADPSGNSGDGGPATAALLKGPAGLAVDAAGNVYIADSSNNQVREIANASGTQWGQPMTASDIYTVAGQQAGTAGSASSSNGDGGPATAANLSDPQQIALDTAGDLYIADTSSNQVREIAGANGGQWSQSMTAGDIYTVAGTIGDDVDVDSAFTQEDGGSALAAALWAPFGIGTDPYGDLFVLQQGLGHIVSQLQEVAATGTASIPPAAGQVSSLYPLTNASGGVTITQPDGTQVNFQAQVSGGGCAAPYVASGQYCTLPQFIGATLNSNDLTWSYSPGPGDGTYGYSQTRSPAGTFPLVSETDTGGNTLTVTYQTPAPGVGNCPSTASSCETVTAASGRSLIIGSDANGRVTSVTDPMSRSWTYSYTGSQLTSATGPMTGEKTSYTYGPSNTSNPLLANDLVSITSPNAQPNGPATVNGYDNLGRVTSQTDPMGFKTTFNYCVNAAADDCLDPATGTGFVTVTDPDGNVTVDDYDDGELAAETHLTAGAVTTEHDYDPLTWGGISGGGTLLPASQTDGDGNTTSYTYDAMGDMTSATAPGPDGPTTTSSGFTSQEQENCDGSTDAAPTATCTQDAGPAPVAPGGVIVPPASSPPPGLTYTLWDTNGNELYHTAGVYTPGATSASYSQNSYQLFNGNSVTLNGTSISCTSSAPTPSLPCATINPDGVVTQLGYDPAADVTSTSTPDGNGSEKAVTTYAYDADGEQTSTTAPDGNLPGANVGNYTTTTDYYADGQKQSQTLAGRAGATVTPHTTGYGYDADGNQTTVTDARGYTTHYTYNADDKVTLTADPDQHATLTCYDGDGVAAQTVPPAGVTAGNLTPASCPASYPSGFSDRLAADATVTTFDANGEQTQVTSPAPAGQSGYETTAFIYDGNGNLVQTTAPATSPGGSAQVSVDTYNSAGELTAETTGYGTSAASTTTYCYDPDGDQTAVVAPDGNTSGTAPCETSSPWTVDPAANPVQAAHQTTTSYDSQGEAVSATTPATAAAPSGGTSTFTYDPVGNKLTRKAPDTAVTTWTYTPQDQPASVSYSDGSSHAVTYAYDANGAKTGMTDATGASSYVYDPFGELVSTTDGAQQTTGYAFNPDGQVNSITYPLSASATWAATKTVSYEYDNADQLASVTDFANNKIGITDTPDGLPASQSLGSTGDTINLSYDNADNPSAIALTNATATLQSFGYSYAPAGTVMSETDTPSSSQSPAGYNYDAQRRVTSMTPGTASFSNYGYDASGALTTLPTGAAASYDHAGELTSSIASGITTGYTYNADGEQVATAQGATTLSSGAWNAAGQLTALSDGAATMTSAAYDGDGLRASSAITPSGGSTVNAGYVWDTLGQVPQLLMDSASAYVYAGGNTPAEMISLATGTVTYLMTDLLGSVRGTVDSSGDLTGTTSYDAWGNPANAGGLTAATPFGFAGGYTDPDGLIYLVDRYYNPAIGQFLSVDPVLGQGQPYEYGADDPVTTTDPTGDMPGECDCGTPTMSHSILAASGRSYYYQNEQHAAGVDGAVFLIWNQLHGMGYNMVQIVLGTELERPVPAPGGKGKTGGGFADITFTQRNGVMLVWEVKSYSERDKAFWEAVDYALAYHFTGTRAYIGFPVKGMVIVPVITRAKKGRTQPDLCVVVNVPTVPLGGGVIYSRLPGCKFPKPWYERTPARVIINAVKYIFTGVIASIAVMLWRALQDALNSGEPIPAP